MFGFLEGVTGFEEEIVSRFPSVGSNFVYILRFLLPVGHLRPLNGSGSPTLCPGQAEGPAGLVEGGFVAQNPQSAAKVKGGWGSPTFLQKGCLDLPLARLSFRNMWKLGSNLPFASEV